jgi:catechol 2,3-dioxygenase-like lactoylglutathione lyase family enzyme
MGRDAKSEQAAMAIRMDHFTILTEDLDGTLAFYAELLDLHPGPRPPFSFPGAWLYAGRDRERAILHIVAGRKVPNPPAGVLDHMAFFGQDLGATVAKLEQRGVEYDLRRLPEYATWQLFFHDPNGAKVEIDYDPKEPAPVSRR